MSRLFELFMAAALILIVGAFALGAIMLLFGWR